MKKVLAVVLSLMMVFSMLPIVSSANTDAVTHQNFLNASERYEKFVTRNAGVPNYVTAGTQRFTAWDYLYAAADAIVDLAGGSSIAVTYKSVAAVAEKNAREDITSGEMLRGEYVALAEAVVEAVDTNNAVPACFGTTLGAVSPKNVSYIFAQILSYYKNNKTLPASVQVDPWVGAFYSKPSTAPEQVGTTSATILASRLMSAAMRVKTATDTNGALPTLVEVDGQVLSMGQFLATAAKVYLSGKTVGEVEVTFADTPEYPVEDMTALTLSKAELDELVTAIDNAMGTTAPASVTYNGSVIGFNTLVYTVASALAQIATNGIVESITVPTWEEISGTALPAPG
ncbi:MAG: hypothetical protein IJO48_02870, partial [Clostridia bacterium]|nr:hypothetical protein [Clostridia bacterium]